MATDYSAFLTTEQKAAILTQRLQQFAAEAWQHQLNKEIATAAGDDVAVKQADEALTILDNAISVHQTELAKIDA